MSSRWVRGVSEGWPGTVKLVSTASISGGRRRHSSKASSIPVATRWGSRSRVWRTRASALLSGDQVLLQGDGGAAQDVSRGRVQRGVELPGQPLEVAGVLGEGGKERLGSGQDQGAGEGETVLAELVVDLGEESVGRQG